jgi:hypothetical protein
VANPARYTDADGETDTQATRRSTSSYPGTPRWVKLGGVAALILVLLVVVVMLLMGGEHGPMRHTPAGIGQRDAPLIADRIRAV